MAALAAAAVRERRRREREQARQALVPGTLFVISIDGPEQNAT